MQTITALEKQIENREQINLAAIVSGYIDTKESGNELLDLSQGMFDHEALTLLDELRELGITEFTFSAPQTNTTDIIWKLIEQGATLNGMVQVKSRHKNWDTGERDLIPAFHLIVN